MTRIINYTCGAEIRLEAGSSEPRVLTRLGYIEICDECVSKALEALKDIQKTTRAEYSSKGGKIGGKTQGAVNKAKGPDYFREIAKKRWNKI